MLQQPSVVHEEQSVANSDAHTLTNILNEIRSDSQHAPQAYLAETEVQHGGE